MLTTFNVTDVSTEETLGSIPWKPVPNEQRSSDPPAESNFFSGLNTKMPSQASVGKLGGRVITSGDRQSRPGYIVNPTVLADDRKVILLAKLLRGPSKKDMSSVMVHMKTEVSDMVHQSLQRTGRLSMGNNVMRLFSKPKGRRLWEEVKLGTV